MLKSNSVGYNLEKPMFSYKLLDNSEKFSHVGAIGATY